jgi:Major Facilitator Superfamily
MSFFKLSKEAMNLYAGPFQRCSHLCGARCVLAQRQFHVCCAAQVNSSGAPDAAHSGSGGAKDGAAAALPTSEGIPKRFIIVALCFVAFMLCNMDRVNMSIAILPMQHEFGWSPQTVGIVQSSFFWCAACASPAWVHVPLRASAHTLRLVNNTVLPRNTAVLLLWWAVTNRANPQCVTRRDAAQRSTQPPRQQTGARACRGYLMTQVLGGIAADRLGGKVVLGLGVVWWSLATVLTPLAAQTSLPVLLAMRALMGIGEGVAMPAMNNMLSRWVPALERSRSLALVYSGMYVGSMLGLGVSPGLIHANGWPSVFYIFGSLGVIWWVVWSFFAASTPSDDPRITDSERKYISSNTSVAMVRCFAPCAHLRACALRYLAKRPAASVSG